MSRACALAPTSRSATLIWRGSSAACAGDPGPHGAEPGVDVEDFAGNRGSEVGEQERGGVAGVLGGHIAAERRMLLDDLEDLAEAADARRGERLDRPGGDAVDADALRAEARGEISHRSLEARLGQTHGVEIGRASCRERV